jgi:hypothetical protein
MFYLLFPPPPLVFSIFPSTPTLIYQGGGIIEKTYIRVGAGGIIEKVY